MDGYSEVRNVIDCLQRPIHDISKLLSLLCGPLDCINLLPPQFRTFNTEAFHSHKIIPRKHIPAIQQALLDHIAPTWDSALAEKNATQLLDQYFCPDSFFFASSIAGEIALMAYTTIISKPLTSYAIHLLARLSSEYPVDRLHSVVFANNDEQSPVQLLSWEDCVRNVMVIPGKVSNAIAGKTEMPQSLEQGAYYNAVSVRTEHLIFTLSKKAWKERPSSISYLLARLASLGVFPSAPPISRSQPSFFQATLPIIRARLALQNVSAYSALWSSVLLGLPSSHTLQSVLTSLLGSITPLSHATSITQPDRANVKKEASLLNGIVGKVVQEEEELWEAATAVILQKDWSVSQARVFVCWLSGRLNGETDEQALAAFIETILSIWSSATHVKHSLLSQHQYLTSVLLITISYLSPSSQAIQSLVLSPVFISAVGLYVGHLDTSVRLCGMLVAEVVAHRTSKKLDFGVWEGEDPGRRWAREMRELLKQTDVEADSSSLEFKTMEDVTPPKSPNPVAVLHEIGTAYDSDDSITGYASSPSSRSASPTLTQLDEIEKDPTLNVGLKKPTRPVYLAQLGNLLRNTGGNTSTNEPHEADKIEMALDCAEELIRKKKGYGTELDENAVNLVYALLGLHNNYELEDFDSKRQGALNALIACAPIKAAPALVEEFFKNQYSTFQRFVALDALALGAREMANLPIPPPRVLPDRASFPSKRLPEQLHQHYLTAGEQSVTRQIIDSISSNALEHGAEEASRKTPEIVRERRLRVHKAPKVTEVLPTLNGLIISPEVRIPQQRTIPFNNVSTEYFILPLINRFWLFLRDEMTREERTVHREGRERYHGAGTGLILNAIVLAHFLRTLAILVHASHNASEWLATVAPDSLELALTIGTRPTSHLEIDEDGEEELGSHRGKDASVLTSALELALVVLDGCLEIDGGRVIGLEHTTLLLGVGEWANHIFSQLEKGLKMPGGGGVHETKLRRAAAGVLLKVDELTSRWRRSMLDTR